VVSNA